MIALIDGDLVAYRCSAAAEQEDFGICAYYMENTIQDILDLTKSSDFNIYLSGPTNFRYGIYPEYKANRANLVRPRHLTEAKKFLQEKYLATVSDNCEADDLMGIQQCSYADTIICSLDKDLLMIPGKHFSWEISGGKAEKRWTKLAEFITSDEFTSLKYFYTQLLKGDPTDNIKGCVGVGPKKAEKLLNDCTTEQEMFDVVREQYSNDEEMLMNGQCLWIQRQPNTIWEFPKFETGK